MVTYDADADYVIFNWVTEDDRVSSDIWDLKITCRHHVTVIFDRDYRTLHQMTVFRYIWCNITAVNLPNRRIVLNSPKDGRQTRKSEIDNSATDLWESAVGALESAATSIPKKRRSDRCYVVLCLRFLGKTVSVFWGDNTKSCFLGNSNSGNILSNGCFKVCLL